MDWAYLSVEPPHLPALAAIAVLTAPDHDPPRLNFESRQFPLLI
jgi:hypothetical protein